MKICFLQEIYFVVFVLYLIISCVYLTGYIVIGHKSLGSIRYPICKKLYHTSMNISTSKKRDNPNIKIGNITDYKEAFFTFCRLQTAAHVVQ